MTVTCHQFDGRQRMLRRAIWAQNGYKRLAERTVSSAACLSRYKLHAHYSPSKMFVAKQIFVAAMAVVTL